MIMTEGAECTHFSHKPYKQKFTDEFGNVRVQKIPRPECANRYFSVFNTMDRHNYLRQHVLKLEKKGKFFLLVPVWTERTSADFISVI